MRRPNFLIIGAQKAGTTSLHYYLSQHPEIFMLSQKETHYFTFQHDQSHPLHLSRGEYEKLFDPVKYETAVGETSPSYLYAAHVPIRIYEYNPEIRLIAILRNPVERAYSSYLNSLRLGIEPVQKFENVIELEKGRIQDGWDMRFHYLSKGFFYQQLSRYYQLFDPSQIKVILFEDLIVHPQLVTKEIFTFLHIDDMIEFDNFQKFNKSGLANNKILGKSFNILRKMFFYYQLKEKIPLKTRELIKNKIYPRYVRLSNTTREKLMQLFAQDIQELETLIGRDLSFWLQS